MIRRKKKNKYLIIKIIIGILLSCFIIAGIAGYVIYQMIFSPNIDLKGEASVFFYIPTGSAYKDVRKFLYEKKYIIDNESFEFVAKRKNYINNVHPGRYRLKNKMSNNELINLLRSGMQEPVCIVLNNVRTLPKLAAIVSGYIEADSGAIIKLLNDENYISRYGFNKNTLLGMFIPNSYQFYWNTSSEKFFIRMYEEYNKFWNEERKSKAKQLKFTQNEVSTLASIVEMESQNIEERPKIAGVYINRLNKGMPLQADPTVIFAVGDFTIKRVLNSHLKHESPYNTYLHTGLPPGPITMPSISSIDGVLNYEKHEYLYFCAKEDFSGTHYFTKTLEQHKLYAKKYKKALNKLHIK
ncbi:MAG: endolytic transglycosylase MltG [Bacteroidia bacterium]|nr:endolytic transglycosylase MltG [Bacteroidia bacterium]